MVTKRQITNDWKQLFPELKKTRLLEMDNRLGPLITGIYLKVIRNTYYTPVFYVHNLCREYSSITTSLECTSETIELEKHEERYMFSAERLKNKLLIPLKGDVSIDKIIEGYKSFLSNPRRKSFEEYHLKNIKILLWFVDGMEKRKYLTISSNIFGIMCKRIKIILFLEIKIEEQKGGLKEFVRIQVIMRDFMKYVREKYKNIK